MGIDFEMLDSVKLSFCSAGAAARTVCKDCGRMPVCARRREVSDSRASGRER